MRIAIISYPRTGSSKLCEVISQIYDLKNLGEFLCNPVLDNKISDELASCNLAGINKLYNLDNYVVKIHSGHLVSFDVSTIKWDTFDIIITTSRTNKTDAFISHELAKVTNNWIKSKLNVWKADSFTVNLAEARNWYSSYVQYTDTILAIKKHTMRNIICFSYDEINDDNLLQQKCMKTLGQVYDITKLSSVPSNINYKNRCLNYNEAEKEIEKLSRKRV